MFVATAAKIHVTRCHALGSNPMDTVFAATHGGWCPVFFHWLRENRYLRWPGEPDKIQYRALVLEMSEDADDADQVQVRAG
jgi:hypothetical protein